MKKINKAERLLNIKSTLSYIIMPHDRPRATKIEHCGNKNYKPCEDRLCNLCRSRTQTKLSNNLHRDNQLLSYVTNGLYFQTFVTVAIHEVNLKDLKKMIEKLNKATKMLWESNREVLNLIAMYGAIEVSREEKALYKPHIHIIVTARVDNDVDVYTALQSYLPLFYKTKIRSSHNVSIDIRPVTNIAGLESYVNKGLYIDKNGNSIISVDNWQVIDDILQSCNIICRYGYDDVDVIRPTVDIEVKKENIKQGIKNSTKKSGNSRKGKKRSTPKEKYAKDFILRNAKIYNRNSTYTNAQIIQSLDDFFGGYDKSTFYRHLKELKKELKIEKPYTGIKDSGIGQDWIEIEMDQDTFNMFMASREIDYKKQDIDYFSFNFILDDKENKKATDNSYKIPVDNNDPF